MHNSQANLPADTAPDKAFILDINVSLNDSALINIEMQVNNLGDWFDRSLSYLCRSFDQLYHGEKYSSTKSVLHIGILDFKVFPEPPEFYASYKLMNVKNHQIYNDKFFDTVAQTLYKSNSDEQIRYACQAREEYEFQMKRRQEQLDEYEFQMKRRQEQLDEYESQMKQLQEELDKLRLENQKLKGLL